MADAATASNPVSLQPSEIKTGGVSDPSLEHEEHEESETEPTGSYLIIC